MSQVSTWMVVSWVFVALITGVNIYVFLKLKGATEQMLKMAFPGAKDMNEALSQMQGMMGAMRGMRSGKKGARRALAQGMSGLGKGPKFNDTQLKHAMSTLQNFQGKK